MSPLWSCTGPFQCFSPAAQIMAHSVASVGVLGWLFVCVSHNNWLCFVSLCWTVSTMEPNYYQFSLSLAKRLTLRHFQRSSTWRFCLTSYDTQQWAKGVSYCVFIVFKYTNRCTKMPKRQTFSQREICEEAKQLQESNKYSEGRTSFSGKKSIKNLSFWWVMKYKG